MKASLFGASGLLLLACSGTNVPLDPVSMAGAAGTTGAAGANAAAGTSGAAGTTGGAGFSGNAGTTGGAGDSGGSGTSGTLCTPTPSPSTDGRWTNRTPATLPVSWPSARRDTAMVYDAAKGKTVMYGGYSNAIPATDTWEWDGAAGTWFPRGVNPPGVFDMVAATYDSARGRVFLFGGESFPNAGPTNDIWEWGGDDATWSLVTPTSNGVPSKQTNALAAYDPLRTRMLIYGAAWNEPARTHGWGPKTRMWIDLQVTNGPMNPAAGALVWDPCRDRGVFFGGANSDEIWEWDWATRIWTQRTRLTGQPWPTPRTGAALVFDTKVGRPLLFGGVFNNRDYFNDIWQWDGQSGTWTNVAGPPAARLDYRAFSGVAFDSARERLVVFSGDASASQFDEADLWEWERL